MMHGSSKLGKKGPHAQLTPAEVAHLRKAFDLFDLPKEKTIDGAELGVILQSIDKDIKSSDIEQLMTEADTDGDGVINFDNFCKMVEKIRGTFELELCEQRIKKIKAGDTFTSSLEKNFPGIMMESEFADALYKSSSALGFDADNTIAAVSTCRDEICKPLFGLLSKTWGEAFDLTSLAGMVFLGTTGLTAALHHAPEVKGKERYCFMAFPHIAVDAFGEVGPIFRPGRLKKSNACGALCAFLAEIQSGKVKTGLDMDDVEYSLMKQRLLDSLDYGSKPTLVELTKLALKVIQQDLERLIAKKVETKHADFVVAVGIQVHGPHWLNKRQDMDYVWPTEVYAMVDGKRHEIKLSKVSYKRYSTQIRTLLQKAFEQLDTKKENRISKTKAADFAKQIVKKAAARPENVDKALTLFKGDDIVFASWLEFIHHLEIPEDNLEKALETPDK